MEFEDNIIDQTHVIHLLTELNPSIAKWLIKEDEIREALKYMILLLEMRREAIVGSFQSYKDQAESLLNEEYVAK